MNYLRWLNRKKIIVVFFLLILIGGFFLRFYDLGKVPDGYNRDEASLGYTAYSLLTTGKDEYGRSWPLSLESFGDWKLPIYSYLTILPVKLFSLSVFSTRFISALAGSISIVLVFFLSLECFRNYKNSDLMAVINSAFFAFLPWNIFFSRVAYEANLALMFTILSTLLFLVGFRNKAAMIFSSIFFVATLFTYHATHIFIPLLIIGLVIFFAKDIYKRIKDFLLPGLICVIGLVLVTIFTLFSGDATKIGGIGIFSDYVIVHTQIELPLSRYNPKAILLGKVFHNKYSLYLKTITFNYLNFFSPEFLVEQGGINPQHNPIGRGNLDIVSYALLLVGGVYLCFRGKGVKNFIPLLILILSPVAASITRDAPHYTRSVFAAAVIPILCGYGLVNLSQFISSRHKLLGKCLVVIVLIVFSFTTLNFLDDYFVHFPVLGAKIWNKNLISAVSYSLKNSGEYSAVVVTRPTYSPYIFYLFEGKYSPSKYQIEAKRYPKTDEGFVHVSGYDKFLFVPSLNWGRIMRNKLLVGQNYKKILFVDWNENIDLSILNELQKGLGEAKLVKQIEDPLDGTVFTIVSLKVADTQDWRKEFTNE